MNMRRTDSALFLKLSRLEPGQALSVSCSVILQYWNQSYVTSVRRTVQPAALSLSYISSNIFPQVIPETRPYNKCCPIQCAWLSKTLLFKQCGKEAVPKDVKRAWTILYTDRMVQPLLHLSTDPFSGLTSPLPPACCKNEAIKTQGWLTTRSL